MNFSRYSTVTTYISRYAYIITLVAICMILTALMWFLYGHVYRTLTQAELVVELKGHVSTQTLQVEQHQSVIEKIKAKSIVNGPSIVDSVAIATSTASTTPEQRKNPFQELK